MEAPEILRAAARLVAAPRAEVLDRVSAEIAPLVAHRAAVMRTADCARAPVKTAGDAAVTGRVTSAELDALDPAPGTAELTRAVLGGRDRRLLLVSASPGDGRGALLALVLDDHPAPADLPDPRVLAVVQGLWSVAAAAGAATAEDTGPGLLAANRAAAAARAQTRADLARAHTTTLSALLAVLRSSRLDDTRARATAEGLARAAVLALRDTTTAQRHLAGQRAGDAFAALVRRIEPLIRHGSVTIDLGDPPGEAELPQEVAITARAVTEDLLHAALARPGCRRVRVAWILDPGALRVVVRDDAATADGGSDAATAGNVPAAGRVQALGGSLDLDSDPGWGTTARAVLPLRADHDPGADPLARLHPRELQVLAELTAGLRNRDIAERLALSEHTVKFHVRNILDKLGVPSRGAAAARARGLGLTG